MGGARRGRGGQDKRSELLAGALPHLNGAKCGSLREVANRLYPRRRSDGLARSDRGDGTVARVFAIRLRVRTDRAGATRCGTVVYFRQVLGAVNHAANIAFASIWSRSLSPAKVDRVLVTITGRRTGGADRVAQVLSGLSLDAFTAVDATLTVQPSAPDDREQRAFRAG